MNDRLARAATLQERAQVVDDLLDRGVSLADIERHLDWLELVQERMLDDGFDPEQLPPSPRH